VTYVQIIPLFCVDQPVAFVIVMAGSGNLSHQIVLLAMSPCLCHPHSARQKQADTTIRRQNYRAYPRREVLRGIRHQLEAIYQHEQTPAIVRYLREVSKIVRPGSLDQQQVVESHSGPVRSGDHVSPGNGVRC